MIRGNTRRIHRIVAKIIDWEFLLCMSIRFSTAAKATFNSKPTIKINETDVFTQYHNDIQSERTPCLPWGLSLKWFFSGKWRWSSYLVSWRRSQNTPRLPICLIFSHCKFEFNLKLMCVQVHIFFFATWIKNFLSQNSAKTHDYLYTKIDWMLSQSVAPMKWLRWYGN